MRHIYLTENHQLVKSDRKAEYLNDFFKSVVQDLDQYNT